MGHNVNVGRGALLGSSISFPKDAVTFISCFLMKVNGPSPYFTFFFGP